MKNTIRLIDSNSKEISMEVWPDEFKRAYKSFSKKVSRLERDRPQGSDSTCYYMKVAHGGEVYYLLYVSG